MAPPHPPPRLRSSAALCNVYLGGAAAHGAFVAAASGRHRVGHYGLVHVARWDVMRARAPILGVHAAMSDGTIG